MSHSVPLVALEAVGLIWLRPGMEELQPQRHLCKGSASLISPLQQPEEMAALLLLQAVAMVERPPSILSMLLRPAEEMSPLVERSQGDVAATAWAPETA